MEFLTNPETWIALVTLTALEVVLGIDNIVFISILAGKLKEDEQERARRVGLLIAMLARIGLLFSIAWLTRLTTPLFEIFGQEITGKGIILIVGGLFLLAKSTFEMHERLEGEQGEVTARVAANFASVIVQIVLLDIVFSIDSVLTAIGMAKELAVMVTAIVIAVAIMLWASKSISDYVNERPTIKILALSFLLLIGVSLIAEGLEFHIPKGYIYFAMAFSLFVEILNQKLRPRAAVPVQLRSGYDQESAAPSAEG
jgi:predicted tellurium resistance membrane protein TerC